MIASFSKKIAPGFHCRNESEIPILFVLSQLSPLHWCKVEPGQRKYVKCGRVFFTASVEPWIEGAEPTQAEVAARIGAIVSASLLLGGVVGVGLVGGISRMTSIHGVSKDGVYADGRIIGDSWSISRRRYL
eukprot:gene9480-10295_t